MWAVVILISAVTGEWLPFVSLQHNHFLGPAGIPQAPVLDTRLINLEPHAGLMGTRAPVTKGGQHRQVTGNRLVQGDKSGLWNGPGRMLLAASNREKNRNHQLYLWSALIARVYYCIGRKDGEGGGGLAKLDHSEAWWHCQTLGLFLLSQPRCP